MKTFAREPKQAAGDAGSSDRERRPASLADAQRQAATPPAMPDLPEVPGLVQAAQPVEDAAHQLAQRADQAASAAEALPREVRERFPDVNLEGVQIVRNSPAAAAAGALAFTQGDVIHRAPGQDDLSVLAQEAAHVVQQRAGAAGARPGDARKAEQAAKKAEGAKRVDPKSLGAAKPGKRQHKDPDGTSVETAKVKPRANIKLPGLGGGDSIVFEGVEGSLPFKAGAYWPKINDSTKKYPLISPRSFDWRIPGFPVAKVTIKLQAGVKAGLETSGTLKYAYQQADKSFSVSGEGKLELFGEVEADVLGGLALDAVFVEGGVGVFCKPKARVSASTGMKVSGTVRGDTSGGKSAGDLKFLTNISVGGTLKGELGLRAWVDGWFFDSKEEWTFAQFPIAYFDGFRLDAGVQILPEVKGLGGTPSAGKVGFGPPPKIS